MTLENKVLETIKKYQLIKKEDKLVIGVSGGPDSMALLHILLTLQEKNQIPSCTLLVAHVNHMLRKEAEEESPEPFGIVPTHAKSNPSVIS